MSGLLAKTVHQSPVVPSQRPGAATGSRPSKSHSYIVVTMGAVASSFGTWRRRGIRFALLGQALAGAGAGDGDGVGVGVVAAAGAGAWATSSGMNARVQQANSRRIPSGSWK